MLRRLSTSTRSYRDVAFSATSWNMFSTTCVWWVQAFSHRFVTWSAAMNHTRQAVSATTVMLSPATFSNISISPNTPPLSSRSRMVRLPCWSMRSMTAAPSASTPTMFRPAPKSYTTSSARKLTSRMSKQVRMACWDSSLIPRNSGDAPISIAFTPPFSGGGPAACL